jgi:hypothetical protein
LNFFKIDAWIITNGYNVGIVQLVGQAIKKARLTNLKEHIIAIGICKWGSVKDVKKITNPQYIEEQVGFVLENFDLICFSP